jgi:hypothetical protein
VTITFLILSLLAYNPSKGLIARQGGPAAAA